MNRKQCFISSICIFFLFFSADYPLESDLYGPIKTAKPGQKAKTRLPSDASVFQCNCGKIFSKSSTSYRRHLRECRDKSVVFTCPFPTCPRKYYSFKTGGILKTHIKNTHKGANPLPIGIHIKTKLIWEIRNSEWLVQRNTTGRKPFCLFY